MDHDDDAAERATDEWLALRCLLGERDAFAALVRRFAPILNGYVRRVGGPAASADDLVQDIWLAVMRGLPRLQQPDRFRSWLFGIAHRVLMQHFRTQYARPVAADDNALAHLSEPDGHDADDPEQWVAVLGAGLSGLGPAEREVLDLFYLQELSIADIASALRLPTGTVKSRLYRAREQLRRQLHPHTLEGALP